MLKRFVPVVLAIALVSYPCGQSAFAQSRSDRDAKPITADSAEDESEKPAQPNEKLKQDVLNMVADAKSDKFSIPKPQVQAAKNNLSRGQKIAVVAVIAAAIVVTLWVVKNNLDDCC